MAKGGRGAWAILSCLGVAKGFPWGRVRQYPGEKWAVGADFLAVVVIFFPLHETLGCAMKNPGDSLRQEMHWITQHRAKVPEHRDWPC